MKKYSQRGTNIRPYYVLYVYILILYRVDFITVSIMFTNIIKSPFFKRSNNIFQRILLESVQNVFFQVTYI